MNLIGETEFLAQAGKTKEAAWPLFKAPGGRKPEVKN
jgi:hypothetical protein